MHACASQRRTNKTIKQIVLTDIEEFEGAVKGYFEHIFKHSNSSIEDIEECWKKMEVKMIEAMNEKLEQEFTRAKIEEALQQMAPLKSQIGACFFQIHRSTVHDEVC